jgi:site-specific DNA recombinase
MNAMQAALYARVSSAHQAEAHTVASQVVALRERIAADGLPLPAALQFIDEGYSGATLVRPALERLRDVAAAGAVDRLYVHSPDRLARKYAYQVLLVDEFQRAGVEVIFLNRELGRSPEDDLLLQVQGMMAEYERAKIIERHRRGKLHAARAGAVNVLSGAPYGYRYVPKSEGRGQAHYEMIPDEARVVRQVFAWIGRDRLTIGEVCRRLTRAGELTRTGKTVWDRSAVWGMLKNPAYRGSAAFGKTQQEPLRPRLRAQRGRPLQPRRAVSSRDVPQEEWITIPVPALVAPEVFAAVQEQLRDNQRHARQARRGALYLLQGLVQCQHCGYAYYGKRLSSSARKGHPRAYAYYRCLGTDAYRFGGERLCQNTQVRTDLLELAVWQEVCALLAHPRRLAEEYQRRLHPDRHTTRTPLTTLEAQLGKLRQGLARLIDSYADALIEKQEFAPRITRLRQRIAHVEAQRQQLAEEDALHTDLRLIIGRLEDFAAQVQEGLTEADWSRKREMIRALVKRVEVAYDQVKVVFRIDPRPGDPSPEKKSLQDCRGSQFTHLGQRISALCPRPVVSESGQAPLSRRGLSDPIRGRLCGCVSISGGGRTLLS